MDEQRKLDEEVRALKADMANLRADIASLTAAVRETAQSRANHYSSKVQDEVRHAGERLREKIAEARGRGAHSIEEMEETISQRPLASVAAAVGLGFIIAKIMDLGSRR